jgi:hypothetical protein
MAEHTLTVPAEYVELFRLAVNSEIAESASWVTSSQEELGRTLLKKGEPEGFEVVDVRGALRFLNGTVDLMEQLVGRHPAANGAVEVDGEATNIAHAAEAMASVVNSRLGSEIDVSPMDGEQVASMEPLVGALGWATARAAEYHELDGAERAAV